MKIKIIENGFSKFNGEISGVIFVDGVSTEELTINQLNSISASMRVENVDEESDEPVGVAESILYSKINNVSVDDLKIEKTIEPKIEPKVELKKVSTKYTREQLEDIADRNGINGIREIGSEFNVRSNSIAGIIEGILNIEE